MRSCDLLVYCGGTHAPRVVFVRRRRRRRFVVSSPCAQQLRYVVADRAAGRQREREREREGDGEEEEEELGR